MAEAKKNILVKVTPAEHNEFKTKADYLGMTLSELVRRGIRTYTPTMEFPPEEDTGVYDEHDRPVPREVGKKRIGPRKRKVSEGPVPNEVERETKASARNEVECDHKGYENTMYCYRCGERKL